MTTIFDLPPELITIIISEDNQSTVWSFSQSCKQAAVFIPKGDPCDLAAHDGCIEILDWAISIGHKQTVQTMCAAASAGHLHIVKYLHVMRDCPWDASTTNAAAVNGHADILVYALDNRCDFDHDVFNAGACAGHVNILELAGRGCKPHWFDSYPTIINTRCILDIHHVCKTAIKREHIGIVRYILNCDYWDIPKQIILASAIRNESILVLGMLVETLFHGVLRSDWYYWAVYNERFKVLNWLYDKKCPNIHLVRTYAEQLCKTSVIEWVASKGL